MKHNIQQTDKDLMNILNEILDDIRYHKSSLEQNDKLLHPQLELYKLSKELNQFINKLLNEIGYKELKTFFKKFNKIFYQHNGWEKGNGVDIKNIKRDYLGM